MCVGLSAKVIKITDGTALVDASGAKRNISVELLEDLEPDLVEEELLEDEVIPSAPSDPPAAPDAESQTAAPSEGEPSQTLSSGEPTPVPENYYDDLYLDDEEDG